RRSLLWQDAAGVTPLCQGTTQLVGVPTGPGAENDHFHRAEGLGLRAQVRLLRSLEMANRRHIDQFESAVMWGGLALLVYLVYLIVSPFLIPLGCGTLPRVV